MKKRILILDDNQSVLDMLQEVLVYEGFEAIIIDETNDLFNLITLHQPALILLDFRLNGKNGGAWCEQLKSNPEFMHIPVILFTAYSNKGIEQGRFGCDDFIAKPFDLFDLIARIKRLTVKDLPQEVNTEGLPVIKTHEL